MISRNGLKKDGWYLGSGRGSQVAMWDGARFVWPGDEMGLPAVQAGAHYEDGGCFMPMEEIPEGKYPTVAQLDWMKEREERR